MRRPTDAAKFNGTVVVEWLNVSTGTDMDPDFAYAAEEILRGYAWVGVSAQEYGVENEVPKGDLGPYAAGIKAWDPERYASLDHPGDAYSYDIFATIGALLRQPGDVDPLGGLVPEVVLADGESQGGQRLVTYVNAIHPIDEVYVSSPRMAAGMRRIFPHAEVMEANDGVLVWLRTHARPGDAVLVPATRLWEHLDAECAGIVGHAGVFVVARKVPSPSSPLGGLFTTSRLSVTT